MKNLRLFEAAMIFGLFAASLIVGALGTMIILVNFG